MGGCCCCASRRAELDRAPVYFYCPQELDENEPLSASHGTSTALPGGILVDTNLDTSSPDTYRAPPAPLPYNFSSVPARDAANPDEDLKGHECKNKSDVVHVAPQVTEDDISKLKDTKPAAKDEDDVCPTCLEEYDPENPRIMTKCEHHFHLSCILEWMERSNTCPICGQIMEIDHTCEQ